MVIWNVEERREFRRGKLERFASKKKVMEQWNVMGLRVFEMVLGSANGR